MSQVAGAASGKRQKKWFETARAPYAVYTSPAISERSRVSRNATWPGVWPGLAMTSRLPIRSPAAIRSSGTVANFFGHAPGELAVDDLLAGEDPRVELGHQDLDRVAESLLERVD